MFVSPLNYLANAEVNIFNKVAIYLINSNPISFDQYKVLKPRKNYIPYCSLNRSGKIRRAAQKQLGLVSILDIARHKYYGINFPKANSVCLLTLLVTGEIDAKSFRNYEVDLFVIG